jgi:hypothetical protein
MYYPILNLLNTLQSETTEDGGKFLMEPTKPQG